MLTMKKTRRFSLSRWLRERLPLFRGSPRSGEIGNLAFNIVADRKAPKVVK